MIDSPDAISLVGFEKYSRGVIGCQCDVEVRQKTLSAPVWRDLVETDGGSRYHTAPAGRDFIVTKHRYPVQHVYVVFKSSLNPNEVYRQVYPVDTAIRVIKLKLAASLHVSPDNLLLTRNRTIIKDSTVLGDLKLGPQCTLIFDVYTKDSEPFSLAGISTKADMEAAVAKKEVDWKDKLYVAIKFKVPSQNASFTRPYRTDQLVVEVKQDLAALFGLDHDQLVMIRGDRELQDRMMLQEIDYDQYGNVEVELICRDQAKLDLAKLYKEKYMNDVITVVVPFGTGFKSLNVEIFSEPIKKPYLGGYRNKLNDTVFHHAYTQTPPRARAAGERACRDTQTAEVRVRTDDTAYSRATQMAGDGVFIPHVTDRLLAARAYETYEQLVARLNHAHYAAVIQRAYRHYRFRARVRAFLDVCAERIARMKEEDRLEEEEMARRLRKDLITKTFPKTREDFDQLYAMVDHWMQAEIARISSQHCKGPKIASYTLLLDKEVELLRCIEEYRVKVRDDYRKLKEKTFLENISKPITWFGYNGKLVAMDTIEVQKARKFKELYSNFLRSDMDVKERLELLVDMKYALQGFDHKLTEELAYLLDQEADLLVRRCSPHQLEFLRRRVAATLVRFIKTSELNSNITKLKDIREYRKMEGDRLHLCHFCNEMKPYTDFPLYTKMSSFAVCTSCSWKDPGERLWIDMTPYKFILKALQREERHRRCWGSLAFVLREKDIFVIVEKIWHSHSAISETNDVTELRLCRWHRDEDWSPWNCFLVTVQEMKAHLKLDEPDKVYDEELVQRVVQKHKLAKAQFEQLLAVNKRFTESGEWHSVRAPATSYLPSVTPI